MKLGRELSASAIAVLVFGDEIGTMRGMGVAVLRMHDGRRRLLVGDELQGDAREGGILRAIAGLVRPVRALRRVPVLRLIVGGRDE